MWSIASMEINSESTILGILLIKALFCEGLAQTTEGTSRKQNKMNGKQNDKEGEVLRVRRRCERKAQAKIHFSAQLCGYEKRLITKLTCIDKRQLPDTDSFEKSSRRTPFGDTSSEPQYSAQTGS